MNVQNIVIAANIRAVDGPLVENGCHHCQHKREVPGDAHIECVKPDVTMTGSPHGIRRGWFMYPLIFDPTWMTSKCENFESVNRACKSDGKSE